MKRASLQTLFAVMLSLPCVFFGYVVCFGAPSDERVVEKPKNEAVLDKDFIIKAGQELAVKGQDLSVKFAAMLNDSRCPTGAQCVWEGDAKILIQAKTEKEKEAKLELNTNQRSPQAASYAQYEIRLVTLAPYPSVNVEKKPSDYVATLRISKK